MMAAAMTAAMSPCAPSPRRSRTSPSPSIASRCSSRTTTPKTEPRDQRRRQFALGIQPRQGRDRGRNIRSGRRPAAHRKCQPQIRREPSRTGRALRRLPQYRRHHRARDRQAAGHHPVRDPGPGRCRADPGIDGKRLYTGSAMSVIASERAIAESGHRSAYWIASSRSLSSGAHFARPVGSSQ